MRLSPTTTPAAAALSACSCGARPPSGHSCRSSPRRARPDCVSRRGLRRSSGALGDASAPGESELECVNRYRNTLREKSALVVIDDVWASHDLEPFRAESPRSRILFTTRDASIAAAVGADEFVADLLTEEQSRDVLARWAGTEPAAMPEEALAQPVIESIERRFALRPCE